jgi:outer membrane phospholipase A
MLQWTRLIPIEGEPADVMAVVTRNAERLAATLRAGQREEAVSLTLRLPGEAGTTQIPPGGYVRREYVFAMPAGMEGPVVLSAAAVAAAPILLQARGAPVPPTAPAEATTARATTPDSAEDEFDPVVFFKDHIAGHEPFYFIAGTKSPNAKFQISFKYRLLNMRGALAERFPALTGLHLAYTQISLWDWKQASAPFVDSSYKPEFFYLAEGVEGGRWGESIRLDLQAGIQHESNGKAGADSRSLNIAYFQPTLRYGKPDGLQVSLGPRTWAYLGSLSENPTLADYRGYLGLRATAGWANTVQLAALGRVGDDWNRGSLQLDLTLPLMRLFSKSLSLYFHVQYFLGYGETLLHYGERSSSLRAGFALYR